MMKIEALLKEKSFSELTELEQLFVLKNMSSEDYNAEHQIIILTEKLKLAQTDLKPDLALKSALMDKMRAKNTREWHLPMPYRTAASLLFCLGIFYFLIKNKQNNAIENMLIIAQIESLKSTVLTDKTPTITALKNVKSSKKKRLKKPQLTAKIIDEEQALLMSFNRKNPNLEWQEEDDEVEKKGASKLQCNSN